MKYVYEYTFKRRRVGEMTPGRIDSAERAHDLLRPLFEGAENELMYVVALNRKHMPIGVERLYMGHVGGIPVRIGEIFRFPIRVNAAAIVLAHNHPSGDPTPSADDSRTTRDCVAAGGLLAIDVLDHLILTETGFLSMGQFALPGRTFPAPRARRS